MKHQKILNLLNDANDPKFMKRKWNIVNNDSNSNYAAANEITFKAEILKPNLCDYNNAQILVTGDITVIAAPATQVAVKNCAPFIKCITKIGGTTIDDAEDLDLVMLIYNLTEYSSNYSLPTESLWFYSKDEATVFNADIVNDNNFKSFKYEANLLGNTVAQVNNAANVILKNAAIAVPLKYLSNFWRSLKIPLINCKVELKLKQSNYCFFFLQLVMIMLMVEMIILFLLLKIQKLLCKGFEQSVHWKEYKTKSENKNTTNKYRYFLESNFIRVNRLFVLVYSSEDADSKRFKTKRYHLPKGIIITGKNSYDQPTDSDIK